MVKPYSAAETAFLIGYADYCKHYHLDYKKTVAVEFKKSFPRNIIWDNLRSKLTRLFEEYGISEPSVIEFVKQGAVYLDSFMVVIPSEVRLELGEIRGEWGFPSADSEVTMPEPSVPIAGLDNNASPSDATSPSSEEQIADHPDTNHRTTTSRVENTPDQSYNKILTTDDDDRITSPSFSPNPSSVIPSNRAPGRKGEATPIYADDYQYEPTPKRKKLTGAPPTHPAASGTNKMTQGLTKTLSISKLNADTANKNKTAEAPNVQTFSGASSRSKVAPVINIDDWLEDPQKAASSSSTANVEESTELSTDNVSPPDNRSPKPSDARVSKRKVVELSDDEIADVNVAPKRQKTGSISLEFLNQKVEACFDMISNMITNQQSPPEEFSEHIHQLIRTFKDLNGSIVENLIRDLDSQPSLKTKHRTMVQKLVEFVVLSNGTVFPKTPAQSEVDKTWTSFYKHIVSTIGPNNVIPNPTPEGAGYLTCAAEGIANRQIYKDQLEPCIESFSRYLKSPHAQQTLFSALFCRWVFASPEPMLNTMHSDGMMQLYNAVIGAAQYFQSQGLETVQHYDKVATQFLFKDPDFQTVHVSRRTSELKSRFETAKRKLWQPSNIPSSLSPSRFAKEVIAFKQKLLLSPKEYHIHFVRPGCNFQANRMQAYNATNEPVSDEKAAKKQVLLCLFPMLTCEEPRVMEGGAGVEDVLCKNKVFFPSFEESLRVPGPGLRLSKMAVLVS